MVRDSVVYANTMSKQQIDFVLAVIVFLEQRDAITKDSRAEYGMIRSNLILGELGIDTFGVKQKSPHRVVTE